MATVAAGAAPAGAPPRTILCADSLPWMREQAGVPTRRYAVVTGLPDMAEIGLEVSDYRAWFEEAAYCCMQVASPDAPAVFCQTDRKHGGTTISKAGLMLAAAERAGTRLLWHKVALKREPGKVDLHRPTYQHLMAFSKLGRPGKATPDVLPPSPQLYGNGMPLLAAQLAVEHVARYHDDCTLVDPFCGRGTTLAMAWEWYGLPVIGIDIDPVQVAATEALRVGSELWPRQL